MARQYLIPENERRIGERLRQFRSEYTGLSVVQFASRIGIDSNRLATYEHGRSRLPFQVGQRACATFNISQRWLVDGEEPPFGEISIPKEKQPEMAKCRLFSDAYARFIKPSWEGTKTAFEKAVASQSFKFHQAGLTVEIGGAIYGAGMFSGDAILAALAKALKSKLDAMPPEKRLQFRNRILRMIENFNFEQKSDLTNALTQSKLSDVKPLWPALKRRLQSATSETGKKTELAKFLAHVTGKSLDLTRVSQWLTDAKSAREPGAEYALLMLHWVEQQERQK